MDRRTRLSLIVVTTAVLLIAALGTVLILTPRSLPETVEPQREPPGYALPVAPPVAAAAPAGAGTQHLADPDWVASVARETGIPERAVAAYGGIALWKADEMPSCGLGWTTLAGIGAVESDHGRHGGSSIGADGTVSPPIFGVPLSGDATAHIPDTDGGAIDGDAEFDRAVGPMQFIPQAWSNWHVDAGADGVEDPQNIDDAVMAAANYLCRASGDMASPDGWRAGVGAYNHSPAYVQSVANAANAYAEAAP